MTRVLSAADKFRGTLTSAGFGVAVARAAAARGMDAETVLMADGGEGLLEAFGGPNRTTPTTDALGRPIEADWRLDDGVALVASSRSNGLDLVGGAEGNDPERASTHGVGALLAAVLEHRPRRLVVGVGGSATSDGGLGLLAALTELRALDRLRRTETVVACDVRTRYTDAATVFGPQKGAGPDQIARLTEGLRRARATLVDRFGVDPDGVAGGGAAGGLAGALAVLGARLIPGVELVAAEVGLDGAIRRADLVVTGEGRLDRTSLQGKVVGAVCARAVSLDRPVLVVCGELAPDVEPEVDLPGATVVSLVERFGRAAALGQAGDGVRSVVAEHLRALGPV